MANVIERFDVTAVFQTIDSDGVEFSDFREAPPGHFARIEFFGVLPIFLTDLRTTAGAGLGFYGLRGGGAGLGDYGTVPAEAPLGDVVIPILTVPVLWRGGLSIWSSHSFTASSTYRYTARVKGAYISDPFGDDLPPDAPSPMDRLFSIFGG